MKCDIELIFYILWKRHYENIAFQRAARSHKGVGQVKLSSAYAHPRYTHPQVYELAHHSKPCQSALHAT